MNSTAIPSKTEPRLHVSGLDNTGLRTMLAFVVLSAIWISMTPFSGGGPLAQDIIENGSRANQLGYGGLALIALGSLLTLVDRRVIVQMAAPGWIAIMALVILSGVTAPDSAVAMRSVVFALLTTATAASIPFLAPNADALSRALLAASSLLLALCYIGLFAFPEAAIHSASGAEPQHAGLWRGVFTHKNIAGPVMASVSFVGLYLMRRGWRASGALVTIAALVFVWNTGSKTSALAVPAVIAMVWLPAVFGLRPVAALAVLAVALAMQALTIGTLYVPLFDDILRAINPETNFTGRTEIWDLAHDYVTKHPWTGFGFDSFWLTSVTENADQPFDREWDPRGIVTGHNGFLDIALFMGFPALLLSIWLFVLAPVWQFLRVPRLRENVLLAELCLMIVAFTLMNAALESFFFRRADPVWLTLVFALFGLRLASRMRIPAD